MQRVLYEVTVDVSPSALGAWDAWHTVDHVPALLRQPGFTGARKYREPVPLADGWIRHVIHYEVADLSALGAYLDGDAGRRIRTEHEQKFGSVTRITRRILHELNVFQAS